MHRTGAIVKGPSVLRLIRQVDLDSPRTTRIARVAVPLLFGTWSLCLGMDANWDLYNYHLYNPFALLNGKLHVDLAPAGLQTYFNPLLDVPYYVMSRYMPAPLVGFLMGALHGLNFVLILAIARSVLVDLPEGDRNRIPLLIAAAGVLTANFLSELGNTMGDNSTALFCLASLLLVLTQWKRMADDFRHSIFLSLVAGLVMGLGVGLKLTNAPFALALCAALLTCPARWPIRFRVSFLFGVGVLVGLAATGGFWLHEMWTTFGNPLFPQFGAVFPNPLARSAMVVDSTWLPKGAAEVLLWPFIFTLDSHRVGQAPIRQIIWFIAYVAFIAWAATWIARRATHRVAPGLDPRARLVIAFVACGYIVWMGVFSIYRYLVSIEVLLPLALFVLLSSLYAYPTALRAAKWLVGIATLVVISGGAPTWGHKGWSLAGFEAALPEISSPSQTTALIVGGDPAWAWLATLFPREISFIQLAGNFPEGPELKVRVNEMLAQRGESAFAIFQGARHHRLENVSEANDYANRIGLTGSDAGCNLLRRIVAGLRLRAVVNESPRASGTRCALGLRPGDEKDLGAESRAEQARAQSILAAYGLRLDPAGCSSHRARVGQGVSIYQWCRVVRG
jgi:Glycosyltransferase family 87